MDGQGWVFVGCKECRIAEAISRGCGYIKQGVWVQDGTIAIQGVFGVGRGGCGWVTRKAAAAAGAQVVWAGVVRRGTGWYCGQVQYEKPR